MFHLLTAVTDGGAFPMRRHPRHEATVGAAPAIEHRGTTTSASTWSSDAALPDTDPTLTPPDCRANATTVTSMPSITPLVVSVLLAQRRLALVR